MSTRLAQAGDARAIAVVHVRSWQAAYRDLFKREELAGFALREVRYRRPVP